MVLKIKHQVTTKSKLPDLVDSLYSKYFELNDDISNKIKRFIKPLKRQCNFFVEYPYVDKVYRDSFYHFYSSKLKDYKRNCIRISVFTKSIENGDFRNSISISELAKHYRGFFVVRPTLPNPIGRTVISPEALSKNNFLTCTTTYPATCNGIKFNVIGFPYSSQDTETIKCAGTALWSLSEYFGYKYAEYKPLLPSEIINVLEKRSSQRLLPSRGLDINKMSYVLKNMGFGTRIYSRNSFDNFEALFSTYVESGIPITVAMDDYEFNEDENHAHALLCVGRENFEIDMIKGLKKDEGIYDLHEATKKFVFIDDNHPPYQLATLNNPAANYSDSWHNCRINHFIAPLYPKIYLDAFKAKDYAKTTLKSIRDYFKIDSDVYLRFYLSSSRSYKNYIALNKDLNEELKELFVNISMPKFIWVGELLTQQSLRDEKCVGLIAIDATESNDRNFKPLIFVLYHKYMLIKDGDNIEILINRKPLTEFEVYKNNLNGF